MRIGIDIGSCFIKAVVLDPSGGLVDHHFGPHNGQPLKALHRFRQPFQQDEATAVGVTGCLSGLLSRDQDHRIDDVQSMIRGVSHLDGTLRNILYLGASSISLIKLSEEGELLDFRTNSACAAGTGGAMALAGLMLQYQDLFGSLYSRMGVLAGGYFLGMMVGNLIMVNQTWSERRASMMSFFCLMAVVFFVVTGFALGAIERPSLRWLRTLREIIFPFVAVLSGLWAGFVAPQCDASNLLGYQNLRKLVGAQWLGFALGMIVAAQVFLPMGGALGTFSAAAGPFFGALLILVLARTMGDEADEVAAD